MVDPGRSSGIITAPQSGPVLMPSQAAPTDQTGVVRQPASSVLQLPQANAAESKYHTVIKGETWTSIARQYQLSVPELTTANGMDPATPLQPGQLVFLPAK